MLNKFVKGRVYIFIDAANTFYAQRTLGWRISYEKLMRYFKKECGENTKCFIYAAYDMMRASNPNKSFWTCWILMAIFYAQKL